MGNICPPSGTSFIKMMIRIAVMAAMLMILFGAGTKAYAFTAAGTVIGNQATASYLDAGGTSRTTNSNLVQTTVSQVKSFTLTADGAKAAAPGQTVYYPHTLTNTGNGADTYALNTAIAAGGFTHTILGYYIDANGDGVPDNSTLITSTGLVPANTQFKYVVAAVVPTSVTSGTTGTIVVGATDTSGTAAITNTDTTTVANSVINVNKSLSSTSGPSPSSSITVTLKYTNSGTLPAANLVLTDVLPSGMTYVSGSGRWSVSGTTALTDLAAGDAAGISYERSGQTVTTTIANVGAGISGEVSFQINIASGLLPTTSANAAITTNTANYKTNTQTVAANTNSVTYTVAQTSSVVANGSSTSSVNGTDEPVVVASAAPGSTIVFNNYVWNTGNGTDSFNAATNGIGTFPANTTISLFQGDGVTPLLDSNGDGIPDTGPLGAGGVFKIVVKATLSTTAAAGGSFSVTLTATSNNDPSKTDTVFDSLTALTANTVDLTNNASLATNSSAPGAGPGTTTVITTNTVTPSTTTPTQSRFLLYVNNTSTVADSYNLSVASAVPAGWTVSFAADGGVAPLCSTSGAALTNTGMLPASGNRLVCAIVTVPAINSNNAAPGNFDITFRVQSALNANVFDTKVDRVTVATLNSMSLTPTGAQQTFPGGSVTYTHTLKNNSNVTQAVTFVGGFLTDSQAAAGWTSAVYSDDGDGVLVVGTDTQVSTGYSVSVAPNASRTLFVRVFAPGSATALSAADITTLTATYTGGTASATDTTSVTDGLLLKKYQVAVGCAAAGPFTYSDAAIPAGANTAPGQCIAYQINATNTTAATITNVALSDNIPANTTLNTGCGAPAATAGALVGGTATNGTAGTVTATAATLASTASFQLTFCVKINP